MPGRIVSFKDLTNRKDISVNGTGTFNIGLSLDGSLLVEKDEENIGILLLHLLVHDKGGSILCPANKDLTCIVNSGEELTGEINLIDGMRLEIADLTLVFIDGPIPKLRRALPRTPGLAVVSSPPAKPVRSSAQPQKPDTDTVDAKLNDIESSTENHDDPEADDGDREENRWLENSWCMLDLPVIEQGMFKGLDTPEKIGILVASYFCKQVQIFTDAVVTTKRLDDIFKMCLETVDQCKEVHINYLGNISKFLVRVPDSSNTQPMHSPAVSFLTQLLTHSLDPVSKVVLILDLLRTFSHFDANLSTMVKHQTTAAVLGCLAAFLDVVEVQQFSMEILAKIATYRPKLERKAPLRDVGIDLVVRGMLHHGRNMVLARVGCRVLANLSNTLLCVLNHWLDTERPDNDVVMSTVDRCESLLVYVFEKGIPAVQTVLKEFRTDLGVSTEGRRFIFYYAKLPQLQLKKSRWLKEREAYIATTTTDIDSQPDNESELELSNQDMLEESCDHSAGQANLLRKESVAEPDVTGILKYTGCYENRRSGERRIIFADDTVGGSESESSESEEELVKSLETSVQLDDETKEQMTIKVRHAMKRTIKRQKSFRGEEVTMESETEDSFEEEKSDENTSETGEVKDVIHQKKVDENDTKSCENENSDHMHVVDKDFGQARHGESSEKVNSEDIEEDVKSNAQSELEESESVKVCAQLESETDKYNKKNMQNISQSGSYGTLRTVSIDDEFVVIETTEDFSKSSTDKEERGSRCSDAGGVSTVGRSEGMETSETNTEIGFKDRNGEEGQKNIPKATSDTGTSDKSKTYGQEKTRDSYGQNGNIDVYFFGKLVRTQIIIYVGSLVFQGEDSKVLLIIDQPIKPLLEAAGAPTELVEYAGSQYGPDMTLMDLEPAIVINIIDAVRYRSVTKDLVHSSLLSLTRTINASLQQDSINTVMLLYKTAFADSHLQNVLTDEDFLKEFRICFQKATERLEQLHSVQEIRQNVAEKSFAV